MRALLLLAVLATAAPATAQVADRLSDLRLATAVRLALVDDARTRTLDVAVAARDGAVTVTGDVSPARSADAAAVARAVRGVRSLAGLGALASGDQSAGPVVRVEPVSNRPAPAESAGAPPEAGPLYHTVERGDTLFGLARRYDTTVETILSLSGRRSTEIQVGQRLRVR